MTAIKTVHYAYPTSPAAREFERYVDGCYYVTTENETTGRTLEGPFATIQEAEAVCDALPGEWCRMYRAHPKPGSRFAKNLAVWAATHEERVKQWQDACARHAQRKTLAQLRKGYSGTTAPRYVAEMSNGEIRRVSFWQARGKPYDFARGRKVAIGSSPLTVIRGHVEHDIPGQPWVRIEDPMTTTIAIVKRPSAKAALAALIAAMGAVDETKPALAKAYQDAVHALGGRGQSASSVLPISVAA